MSAIICLQEDILTISIPVRSADLYGASDETSLSIKILKTFTATT